MFGSNAEQLLKSCPTCYKKSKIHWNTTDNDGYCTNCGKMRHAYDRQEMENILRARSRTRKSETEQKTSKTRQTEQRDSHAVNKAKNPTGGVYLIKMSIYYKIGKADNFELRIKQVKLQMPEKGIEIHRIYTDDPLGIEAYWHRRFKHKRANGEWFTLTEEDVAIFKARNKM